MIQGIDHDLLESERYVRQALLDIPLSVIGERLRAKRLGLGLSIRSLAAKALVSKTSIVSLEQGKSCRPATLVKIAGAMGLHVDRFFDAGLPSQAGQARAHRHEDDLWFKLLDVGSGPVEGLRRPLSPEERDRLREAGHDPLMLMFRNVPLGAGFVAGIIELASASEPRRHPGREFLYVLHGKASIRVGAASYDLDEGECLYFEGDEEHTYGPQAGSTQAVSLLCLRVD